MEKCQECGEKFDTGQGLWIHRVIEHEGDVEEWEGEGTWESMFDAVRTPRYSFFIGFLAGMILIAALILSSPSAFQDNPGRIGERTLNHYSIVSPPGVEYELMGVEEHASGTYAVTLQVSSGSRASNETVYVAKEGGHVFESPPSELSADVSALGEQ